MKTGEEYFRQYEPFFGNWYIRRIIGEGSYGQVYEIERNEFGRTYLSALKAISIPQNISEIKSLSAEGMTAEEITGYYDRVVQDIINEYVMMSKLKGNSNIVSYEDHAIHRHKDNIGYDILIRMELLTPLTDYVQNNRLTRRDVIRLGIDICKALELCRRSSIIHRDIKPENIFVSQSGDYKLGDFGIARSIDSDASGISKKGTYTYMAPEMYKGGTCDFRADIYSLGIVMYRLLNFNRTPFLPDYPKPITYENRESALVKRISGLTLPAPANGKGRLGELVLKACAYEPKDRFDSAEQMGKALEAVLYQESERILLFPGDSDTPFLTSGKSETAAGFNEDTPPMQYAASASRSICAPEERTAILSSDGKNMTAVKAAAAEHPDSALSDEKGGRASSRRKAAVIGVVLAILFAGGVPLLKYYTGDVRDIQMYSEDEELGTSLELMYGDTLNPAYRIIPRSQRSEKISLETEDEEIAAVAEDGSISAAGVGSTKIVLSAGKYSEELEVTVKPKITDITGISDVVMSAGGKTERLKPVLHPKEYRDEEIKYSSKDPKTAEVDSSGRIKALKAGTTSICIEAGGFSTSVKVRVKANEAASAGSPNTEAQISGGSAVRKAKSGSSTSKRSSVKKSKSRKASAKKKTGGSNQSRKTNSRKKKASGGVKW